MSIAGVEEPKERREKFIPVTRYALMDRLTAPGSWPGGTTAKARRFFRYLDHWRHQQHTAKLMELEQGYEVFSPDSDLLATRVYTPEERLALQKKVIEQLCAFLKQANYEQIEAKKEAIITPGTAYGLDFELDMDAFEEVLIFYRGKSTRRDERRTLKKFYRKQHFDVPIYRRLCLIFKLKPREVRLKELLARTSLTQKEAEKKVNKLWASVPPQVTDKYIYLKLFKNLPTDDLEMIFPNTQVRFRMIDKLKLGGGAGFGVGVGVYGTATKAALLLNPYTAVPAVAGFGAILFRQAMNFINEKRRYMVVLAQNLYFHSMADNRGVMVKLADRASEEDVKEEMLLYSVLAKETTNIDDLKDVDAAIENYLMESFGVSVDFDVQDALDRLSADGIVKQEADGTLRALPPADAAEHLDSKWDTFLDNLSDPEMDEGREFGGTTGVAKS